MFRWIFITVLSIGIIGVSVWGYQEHQEKNAILIQAENNYQRSFHELTYNLDLLHDKIGSTLAMNSRKQLSPQLAEIWRLTSMAHNDVGQLPLILIPFNKTEEFLSQMGDFSYRVAIRDLDKEPLSEDEINTLESLYEMSGDIESELRKVQNIALKENLRWMDVQLALVNNDQQADNTIIDGFKTVEKNVEGYSEGKLNASLMGTSSKKDGFKMLGKEKISEEDAKKKMRTLLQIDNETELTIAGTGKGANLPLFSGSFKQDNKSGYIDITQQGGYPLTLMINREVSESNKSLHEAMKAAEKYLSELDFTADLAMMESNQYDNVGVFQFVPKYENVWIYPDAIQVKVALDNAEVLGFVSKDYLENYHERKIPQSGITEEEAREKVNSNLKIEEHHLAIIENDIGEEVMAYVFLGTLNRDTYKIFIDASNGDEIRVDKLKQAEIKY
ncbi:spore germination protein YpeB [Gracilibacillus boraciitolerans JCM 21714]|uniref:Spore germination protein YpeB n=1 Tax=Gracilibacillus boraciitolerans JCM 21714 TaxID=1298598 RepID=W4VD62_9BACI|nr:germination protein YpeB [Gracilibacillus boraciitolerans]GAE91345.1 spore germination protein YpeB [Gracilibacillus boraciitolerans JCM 21714]